MHPTHVIDFIDYKLPEYQKRYDESKAKHDAMLANYESKNWFVKIFCCHPLDKVCETLYNSVLEGDQGESRGFVSRVELRVELFL